MTTVGVPEGWQTTPLGDLAEFVSSGSRGWAQFYAEDGATFVRIGNLNRGTTTLDLRDVQYVRPPTNSEGTRTRLRPGDIVISITADLGMVALVPSGIGEAYVNQHVAVVRLRDVQLAPYVAWFLTSGHAATQFDLRRRGAVKAGLGLDDVRNVRVWLPPESTQKLIVAEIEKHLTRIDAGVAALERVQANLKRYRASVLKAAVQGRLVPTEAELARKERRDYEPASKLLARILKERRARWEAEELAKLKAKGRAPTDDRWKAKYKEPEPPDTSELPELPEGWCWATVEQVGNVSGGVTKNAKRNQLPIELPYLRVANVYADELRLDEVERIHLGDAEVDRVLLQRGDLLVVEGNGSVDQIGRVAIWDASIDPCVHQNHLIKVRLVDQTMGRWVLSWLLCPSGRDMIVRVASSTAGLHTLSLSKVEQFVVPLAPREEQRRALELVDVLVPSAVVLAREANAGLGRAARLRSAVLRAAFEGKLVPPASTDEPPSEPSQQGSRTTNVLVHAGPVRGRTKKRNRETEVDA